VANISSYQRRCTSRVTSVSPETTTGSHSQRTGAVAPGALFRHSDQRQYFLPCPGCGLEQALGWETNVDFDRAIVVCRECREPMNVLAKGRWIAQAPGNSAIHGYQLSRLYSPWANIPEMIEASQSTTPSGMQEFMTGTMIGWGTAGCGMVGSVRCSAAGRECRLW
jgi:phage terminase large subunit GpA-like protein